jgi:predicted nucleic acid-binding protein
VNYLDTNAVLALFRDDDPLQSQTIDETLRRAAAEGEPWVVTESVAAEMMWVLESIYGMPRAVAVDMADLTLSTAEISAWDAELASCTFRLMADNPALDFTDCLLAARAACEGAGVLTFDAKLIRLIEKSA